MSKKNSIHNRWINGRKQLYLFNKGEKKRYYFAARTCMWLITRWYMTACKNPVYEKGVM